jgi:hypothetical protein
MGLIVRRIFFWRVVVFGWGGLYFYFYFYHFDYYFLILIGGDGNGSIE